MSDYRHILYATDLTDDTGPVADQVEDLARRYQAKVSLLHVLEEPDVGVNIELEEPTVPVAGDVPALKEARARLATLAKRLGVPEGQYWVMMAHSVAHQIHHVAEEQGADLIIVGTHGRHGLALLLGSTSDAVLRGASCDVLAVRVKP